MFTKLSSAEAVASYIPTLREQEFLFPHFHISVDHALDFDHFNRCVGALTVLVYNFLMSMMLCILDVICNICILIFSFMGYLPKTFADFSVILFSHC